MRRRSAVLLAVAAATLAAGCTAVGPPGETPDGVAKVTAASVDAAAPTFTNWPTYHGRNSRSGVGASVAAPPLHRRWHAALAGAVYGEPILVNGTLIAATERNWVYGLDPSTGSRLWRTHLGTPTDMSTLPCGNIDPLGITGTPAYDAGTGSVFVVAETPGGHHTLWALDAANGDRRWHRSLDVLPNRNRKAEQQRAALLVTHHRVIATFGGLAGDCANYVGYATSVPTDGTGRTYHYAVPTPREAGMWAPGGPAVAPNRNVYVAAGNGARVSGRWDKSDSVTELSPVRLTRFSVFAPRTWRDDNARDLDLGSSSPVPVNGRIVIAGKRGVVYLLHERLGGVASAITHIRGCHAFGGAAHIGKVALMPCKADGYLRALVVGRASLHWKWRADNVGGSPVVAGAFVYAPDPASGDLVVLRLATGRQVQRIHVGALTHFPSATLSGGLVFVPSLTGVTAFSGS